MAYNKFYRAMRSKKAMQTVKIVTQSGSDLTFDIAEKHGIVMLPDYVIFGERSYRNNIDIHAEGFYDMLVGRFCGYIVFKFDYVDLDIFRFVLLFGNYGWAE